jgi:predicted adenine nucleotide alpha hydrolase (AANH) superfamily ATPase
MRLLLHICCGPCAIAPVRRLLAEGHEVDLAFVNPNIHPFLEFVRRRDAAREAANLLGVRIVAEDPYGLLDFLESVAPREDDRCRACYDLRLGRVAQLARSAGYDAFTTTMLVSTHQDHDAIREAAEEASRLHGVAFLYRDFRPGVMEGVRESKRLGLYRQQYCGCVLSEWERYREEDARREARRAGT